MADRVRVPRGGGIRVPTAIRDRATARETRYYFLIGSLFAKLARGIRDCRVTRELFIIFGRAEGREGGLPFALLALTCGEGKIGRDRAGKAEG